MNAARRAKRKANRAQVAPENRHKQKKAVLARQTRLRKALGN